MGRKRSTREEFVNKAVQVHGNKYDYSNVEYINSKTKVIIKCPDHGIFYQCPGDHIQGQGCKKCSINAQKLTTENFKTKATTIHGNKYDYNKVIYCSAHDKIIIICPKHGQFEQEASSHLQGHGCFNCAVEVVSGGQKLNNEFVSSCFNEKGCILLSEYKNSVSQLRYICKCGKENVSTWASFRQGCFCKSCGRANTTEKQRKSNEEVRHIFEEGGCELLDIYERSSNNLRYICNCGRESATTLSNFRKGVRCKQCAGKASPTLESLHNIFKENNCELLEEYYDNENTPMRFRCSCGNEDAKCWAYVRDSKTIRCKECYENSKYTQEEVENIFKNSGCKFLGNYQNTNGLIPYICNCGRESVTTFSNFRKGVRCKQCANSKLSGTTHYAWNPDREYIKLRKSISRRCVFLLRSSLKQLGQEKDDETTNMLGYSRLDLLQHIISHPNWIYVKDLDWHIDHIFPIKAFVEHGIHNLKIINALDNLRPILATDNLSKGSKYNKQEFSKYLSNYNIIL